MWINTSIALPLKSGEYTCLVQVDDFGNLEEHKGQVFEGADWSHYHSGRQFIRYWFADQETAKIISDHLEQELNKYHEQLAEEAKNFGGI